MIKVLFAAAEAVPFAKTGGLADIVGTLPRALKKLKVDARVIVPLYGDVPESFRSQLKPVSTETVQLGWRRQHCGLFELQYEGVTVYFIDNEYYFRRKGLYNFYDEAERFGFFSKAVLDVLPRLNWTPDILHCHDWHTGMIPVLLRSHYCKAPWCSTLKTLCTIHNLEYQGIFPTSILGDMFNLDHDAKAVAALNAAHALASKRCSTRCKAFFLSTSVLCNRYAYLSGLLGQVHRLDVALALTAWENWSAFFRSRRGGLVAPGDFCFFGRVLPGLRVVIDCVHNALQSLAKAGNEGVNVAGFPNCHTRGQLDPRRIFTFLHALPPAAAADAHALGDVGFYAKKAVGLLLVLCRWHDWLS